MMDLVEVNAFRKYHRKVNQLNIAFRRRDIEGFFQLIQEIEEASEFLPYEDYLALSLREFSLLARIKSC